MPVGHGKCLCCIGNEIAYKCVMIFDILTAVLIITIPRAIGAVLQMRAGPSQATVYGKLRLANWLLIFVVAIVLLIFFSFSSVQNGEKIDKDENFDRALEITCWTAGALVFVLLDFHFCQVIVFKMRQIKFNAD